MTSMPASRMSSTSCQRFSRGEPGHVGVGQLVDEGDRRVAGDDRVGVHLLDVDAAVLDRGAGARSRGRRAAPAVRGRPWISTKPTTMSVPRSSRRWPSSSIWYVLPTPGRHAQVHAQAAAFRPAFRRRPGRASPRRSVAGRRVVRSSVEHHALRRQQPVEVEVQLEDVDDRLAEEAEQGLRRVPGDDGAHGVRGHAPGGRDPGHLVVGRGRADVRIEAGGRGRDQVDRDRARCRWRPAAGRPAPVMRSMRALLVGPEVGPGARRAVVAGRVAASAGRRGPAPEVLRLVEGLADQARADGLAVDGDERAVGLAGKATWAMTVTTAG